ncbi:reverse transcriptase domain-containing protein [Tanacetum coccineum]
MSVRLADRSFQYPVDIAENMPVDVGKFTFPIDFVILEMEEDSKVPLILGRPFLHTADVIKTSIEEPPTDLELKPLPDNLEYVFLEEASFLRVIISSQLSEENKNKLISTIVHTNHSALRHLFKKQDAKPRLIRWILLLQEFDIKIDAKPRLIRWILLLQEFDIKIKDRKGIENVAADHLSRIENEEKSDDSEVDDNFLRETLMEINTENELWFADFANYLASDIIPKGMTYQQFFFLIHQTLLLEGTLPLQSKF